MKKLMSAAFSYRAISAEHPAKIGITGVMGSGKSLLGQLLAERGAEVLDTDAVVAGLYQQAAVQQQLVQLCGPLVLNTETQHVDKAWLAAAIFADPSLKQQLEALIHPLVRAETQAFLQQCSNASIKAVLVPLLFEAGSQDLYDEVWCTVVQDEQSLMQRIVARNPQWSPEAIQARWQGQWSQSQKAELADEQLDNTGAIEDLVQQVDVLLQRLNTVGVKN